MAFLFREYWSARPRWAGRAFRKCMPGAQIPSVSRVNIGLGFRSLGSASQIWASSRAKVSFRWADPKHQNLPKRSKAAPRQNIASGQMGFSGAGAGKRSYPIADIFHQRPSRYPPELGVRSHCRVRPRVDSYMPRQCFPRWKESLLVGGIRQFEKQNNCRFLRGTDLRRWNPSFAISDTEMSRWIRDRVLAQQL